MTDNMHQAHVFRKSHIILIFRLVLLELIFITLYLLMRIPKSIILPQLLGFSADWAVNVYGVLYFLILSTVELLFVLQITLDWANEEYEIRDGAIIHRRGTFRLREEIYSLRNLGFSKISQSFFGKLFNYGTIILFSPILKSEIFMYNIHNPRVVVSNLEDDLESRGTQSGTIIRRQK